MKNKKKYNSISTHRENVILRLIFENHNFTREDIIKRTEINSFSVYSIISELIQKKIVIESEDGITKETGKAGRKSRFLSINPNFGYVIGISIEHDHNIKVGLYDFGNKQIEHENLGKNYLDFNQILDVLVKKVNKILDNHGKKVKGIGIARPGITKVYKNQISGETEIFDWEDFENVSKIKKIFNERFNLPVFIGPKNVMASLAEYWALKNKEYKNVVFMDVSDGVGAGIIVNGSILEGGKKLIGDIGHMIVESKDGRLCVCGNRGCLGAMVSIPSIISRIKEAISHGVMTSISSEEINFETVVEKFVEKDKLITDILNETAVYLAVGIVNIINILSPEIFIIGGKLKNFGEELEQIIRDRVKSLLWIGNKKAEPVIKFSVFEDALERGAGLFALKNLISDKYYFNSVILEKKENNNKEEVKV